MSDTETGITAPPFDADLAQILDALGERVESIRITTRVGDCERIIEVRIRTDEAEQKSMFQDKEAVAELMTWLDS